jgi:hypothetical protein
VNPNKETNMTKATACAVDSPAKTKACPDENRTEKIAILAFLRWEQSTGGVPVDDKQTEQFWLDAEKEVLDGFTGLGSETPSKS